MDKQLKRKALQLIQELKKLIPKAKIALKFSNPWEMIVAVILSARTQDKKVNEVTEKLFKKYKTLEDYIKADQKEFEKDIAQIGLYRDKAKRILETAKILKQKYKGKIPKTISELITLPGIGRKTANIILNQAYGIAEGIAVDTHVHRLARLFGLTKENNPEKIEQDLIRLIPKPEWLTISYRLIDYGRKYCPASCKHQTCPLRKFIAK
jgi:endonuclease-3